MVSDHNVRGVELLFFPFSQGKYVISSKGGTRNKAITGGGQNNGNTKKLRNRICVGYTERTSVGSTECSSVCLYSVAFESVH
jgi:hypothetical protein